MDDSAVRQHIFFDCDGARCAGTFDLPAQDKTPGETGMLIVSGGNEIRSGAHGGQAALAAQIAAAGHPVFRYDRRGVGDSEGENSGFEGSSADLMAAVQAFRDGQPALQGIIAFGNCDAATALALFHRQISSDGLIDGLILANPWIIEQAADNQLEGQEDKSAAPSAAAIRARYLNRLKDPRSIIDLFTGKINLRKLAGGLLKASRKEEASPIASRMSQELAECDLPIRLLIARHDSTALSFVASWNDQIFAAVRPKANIEMATIDSASHSFAGSEEKEWLKTQIFNMLK